MIDMTAFDRVKKMCDEQKFSVVELEERLGFSRNSLYSWKKNKPSSEKLEKVADYFNVSTDYLLGRTAFKKPMELFEHWNGQNNPYFESPFDFGELLKEVREEQGVHQKDVSKALGITELDVNDIEHGVLPLNFEWAEKYANFLGTTVEQIFINKGMGVSLDDIPLELLQHYQEQGMSEADMVAAYLKFKKAEYEDAMSEGTDGPQKKQPYYELTEKDEANIKKQLKKVIDGEDVDIAFAAFDGIILEDLNEEDRELLINSWANTFRLTRRMAKEKFTPYKYRD